MAYVVEAKYSLPLGGVRVRVGVKDYFSSQNLYPRPSLPSKRDVNLTKNLIKYAEAATAHQSFFTQITQ